MLLHSTLFLNCIRKSMYYSKIDALQNTFLNSGSDNILCQLLLSCFMCELFDCFSIGISGADILCDIKTGFKCSLQSKTVTL